MKKTWQLFKAGVVPLFIASVPIYLSYLLWTIINESGLHLTESAYYDVPITVFTAIASACLCGYFVSLEWFQKFAKKYLLAIPVVSWLVIIFVLPKRKLNMVEIRTTWGPTLKESCWEYALETRDPWEEDGEIWHRVHTLGWTAKLYSRIGDANIRPIAEPPHKIWMRILSLGLT